jgi:hypothetical protein
MKTMQKLLFLVLIYQALPFMSFSQAGAPVKSRTPDKPYIFSGLPQKFECNRSTLRSLFTTSVNDEITLELTRSITFTGKVSAKVQQDANVLSINILSSNFPGTLLNISLIIQPDKSEKMVGRFINPRNGDVLMIGSENDRYFITKDLQKFVMADCPLPVQSNTGL